MITYNGMYYTETGSAVFTDLDGLHETESYWGPNMLLDAAAPAAVPEPGTLALLGIALLGLPLLRRKS